MSHRIRQTMLDGVFGPMGRADKIVEVDETFIGNNLTKKPKGEKRGADMRASSRF